MARVCWFASQAGVVWDEIAFFVVLFDSALICFRLATGLPCLVGVCGLVAGTSICVLV